MLQGANWEKGISNTRIEKTAYFEQNFLQNHEKNIDDVIAYVDWVLAHQDINKSSIINNDSFPQRGAYPSYDHNGSQSYVVIEWMSLTSCILTPALFEMKKKINTVFTKKFKKEFPWKG